MIIQFILEIYVSDKNYDKNKMKLPAPFFYSFLNC